MSGVANPQYPITEPFGAAAVVPADITLPVPVPSQAGILIGAASFEDGFPPTTRTDPTGGGSPPYGQDFNGILYMMSAYCAMLQAGQIVPYSAEASAIFFGYAVGAQVKSLATSGLIWTNVVDGNTSDPDVDDGGWSASVPLYGTDAPAAGTFNNVVLPGASDFFLDVDTTAGNVTQTGFVAQRNGQRLTITNTGANLYTLDSLTGSSAANQVRGIPGGVTLVQNQSVSIQYSSDIGKWVAV